jgi:PIN domain nuclease of toxin-antitoxin system
VGRRCLSRVLLDTHAWAWSLAGDGRLSAKAVEAILSADTVAVSAISFYEIGQKVRLGKWPEMEPHIASLLDLAVEQGCQLLPVSPAVSLASSVLDWPHRDPFDRIIGLTALDGGFALVSADAVFDELATTAGWIGRIW